MTDEPKKYDTAAYQRRYRAKQKAEKTQAKLLLSGIRVEPDVAVPTKFEANTLMATMKELGDARLLIHQAAVIFAESSMFGINKEATEAFVLAADKHLNAVESRPPDVKMMYPAAKKISEIIMSSNGFADIRISMLSRVEESLRNHFDGWEDAEKIDHIMEQMRNEFGGRQQ